MKQSDAEWLQGVRLAIVAVVCALISAGLVIGVGELLLRDGADGPPERAHPLRAGAGR